MAKQIDNLKSGSDQWKTILAVVIVVAALALYYINPLSFNSLTKVLVTLVWFVVAGGVFIKSSQGDRFQHFLKETRIELRKVVWPNRQETFKTTGIIMIAVVIVAIFLWIVDAFFTWGVQSISAI
ncbi:MAG: preprotein translocase subunit SecE [Prochlorococcaceae cyanobacterium ETNP1_MAG_9]|nr:preprotein translocase subunit SecE [Prochlorococcaceae cyanobacterium ETNP1_MAG_9]